MRNPTYLLIIALFLFVQHSNAQEKFVLEGKLTGYDDSILFKILPFLPNGREDRDRETEMYLSNGTFRFTCKIKAPTKFALLAMPKIPPDNPKDFEAVTFWVENRPMTLIGEKGNLFNSRIIGSKIQDENEELIQILAPLEKGRKEIKDSVLTIADLSEKKKGEMRIRYGNLNEEFERKHIEFILNHPSYYFASAEIVSLIPFSGIASIDKNKVIQFYNQLSQDYRLNEYGLQIKTFIDKNEARFNELKIGDKPYLFSLPDSSGTDLNFASLKGKIILLDFWASGCGPCRLEHKNYLEVYQKYQSKGFEILSVSQDQSKKQWIKAMQKDSMIWKSVWDANIDVTRMYHITGIPANYLINTDGIIIDQDLRGDKLWKKLDELYH